jgi:hypothetical protein
VGHGRAAAVCVAANDLAAEIDKNFVDVGCREGDC